MTRSIRKKQNFAAIEHDVPIDLLTNELGEPSKNTYMCVQVHVNTVQEAKDVLLRERDGVEDEEGRRIVVINLKVGSQRHRVKLWKTFCEASAKVDEAIAEVSAVEIHPYDQYLASVVKKAHDKVASTERTLLKEEGIYKQYVFGNQGANDLAKCLPMTLFLEELILRGNNIKAVGVKHLCDYFKDSERLRVFDLDRNPIGVKGAEHLAEALKTNESLQVLRVSSCELGGEGCGVLCDALHENQNVVQVSLRNNDIGDLGAERVSAYISNSSIVETIDISTNRITVVGLGAINRALKLNSNLKEINLAHNQFTSASRDPEHRVLLLDLRVARVLGVWN